jgi:transcriptional regulator with GAF, ATPase, and Fis domain
VATHRRESGARIALAVVLSLAALSYSIAVVVVAKRAPNKGFVTFTGHKVVNVIEGGPAARAGIRVGDVIAGIDGQPVVSTADYIDRLLRRSPGDRVSLDLARGDEAFTTDLVLEESPMPWPAVAATMLASVLVILGLIARYGRPGDVAALRFWRTTVVYSIVYAGALSWTHLLVHPVLLALFCATLFLASPLAADFALVFPVAPSRSVRRLRVIAYAPATLMLIGIAVASAVVVSDFREGLATDRGFNWVVRFIMALLVMVVVTSAIGLYVQYQRSREARGAERNQVKWLMVGFTLSSLPAFAAVPFAFADIELFLLVRYRPFVVSAAILWFAANSLAVLRIRLADVDAIIHRSVAYGMASGGAVVAYLAVVLGVGLVAERYAGGDSLVPHVFAALTAAALFGPLRDRVGQWIDRRFFRDRVHYMSALRELAEKTARIAEPPELARAVVDGSVSALRATSGALFLRPSDASDDELVRVYGDSELDASAAPDGGIAIPIGDGGDGVLVLGERRGGDMYSSDDRDLLAALAGQLAIAFENARAYGTIAEMTRTLEAQNQEIRELRDKLEDENRYLKARLAAASDDEKIVGSSKAARELIKSLERVSASAANVLLAGESGTGKGLVARTIHASSERADNAFIHVDCGAIPHGVFESELFGHERGAFTGAVRKRRGHFELADNGTLFLDEIGELPLDLQPKLLRALQERSVLRVGGSDAVSVDVRIIAATNRDLEAMVSNGRFREDLYYRLRVVEITVPPLRQRKSDIPALIEHMLPRLCRRNRRGRVTIADDALERLAAYGWPGNVRELENVLERAVVLCDERQIGADDLVLSDTVPSVDKLVAGLDIPDGATHEQVMEAIEKKRLETALRAAGGNQSGAARSLGMARTTFINKLRRFDLI